MIELREYQKKAIESIYEYFDQNDGNPLLVLPTGTGKSLCIAAFLQRALQEFPATRALVVTHVAELISQNYLELIGIWPVAPAGIYSAGLRKRDLHQKIIFCGIQSIYKKAYALQRIDLMLIDEAHLVGDNDSGMYRKFINDLRQINPDIKIIGLSATPYRMKSGLLYEGDDRIFTDVAYEVSIVDMINQGFLTPVRSKNTNAKLDVSGVGKSGGEFIARQLESAVDQSSVNDAVVGEIIERGADRKSWLIFCSGVNHAEHIRDKMIERGISCQCVTANTPREERVRIVSDFKAGRIRALTNANVFTVGFNAPNVDLIAMLRPTLSKGLFVQMVGRGTRLWQGKTDCILLDFAGNTTRHGPIDMIDGRAGPKGTGDAPVKTCPACDEICHAAKRVCPCCGHEFPAPELKIVRQPFEAPVLSTQIEATWVDVDEVTYRRHEKRDGRPSLRVDYHAGMLRHSEWVMFEHSGYPRQKAVAWWQRRAPTLTVPATVDDALARADALPKPAAVQVRPVGKFVEIVGVRFA